MPRRSSSTRKMVVRFMIASAPSQALQTKGCTDATDETDPTDRSLAPTSPRATSRVMTLSTAHRSGPGHEKHPEIVPKIIVQARRAWSRLGSRSDPKHPLNPLHPYILCLWGQPCYSHKGVLQFGVIDYQAWPRPARVASPPARRPRGCRHA